MQDNIMTLLIRPTDPLQVSLLANKRRGKVGKSWHPWETKVYLGHKNLDIAAKLS